ncbi:MAG: DNA polymerase III subunit delta' [Alphaproteobacteria bacterium]|nr:DNA polymerase III subunit delta' [Alphaproteobacteria bacterium]
MARATKVGEIVELPQSDRLDGFPHPRETDQLFGHQSGEQELVRALAGGQVHHGWLFSGPAGIGKATLAYRFAKCLLAHADERQLDTGSLSVGGDTQAARQVVSLSHPGLLVLRRPFDVKAKRFSASIPVDEVRRLKSFLSHRASDGQWRAVIVDTADDLNVNAANALLKSLEEPPARTVFVLISSEPGRLLNTIRSRCRSLVLPALDRDALRQAARQAFAAGEGKAPSSKDWDQLVDLSHGSVRRLIAMHFEGGLEIYARIGEIFDSLAKPKWGQVHQLAEKLGPVAALEKYKLYHELFFDHMARLIKVAASGEGSESEVAMAGQIVRQDQLASWAALWETLVREEAETRALNLDRKAFILSTVQRLEAAARQ